MRDGYTTITEIKNLPTTEHWAVLVNESMQYDDGYGERGNTSYSTLNYTAYIAFENEEALRSWILRNDESYSKKTFQVIHVKPAQVRKHVSIDLDIT